MATWRAMTAMERDAALALDPQKLPYASRELVTRDIMGKIALQARGIGKRAGQISDAQARSLWRTVLRRAKEMPEDLVQQSRREQDRQTNERVAAAIQAQAVADAGRTPVYRLAKAPMALRRITEDPAERAAQMERWNGNPYYWERMREPFHFPERGSSRSLFMWLVDTEHPVRLGLPNDGHE